MTSTLSGLNLFLLMIGIVLVSLILVLHLLPLPSVENYIKENSQSNGVTEQMHLELRELKPLNLYMEISSRSIFNVSRKPLPLPISLQIGAEQVKSIVFPKLLLIGIIISSGDQVAVLKSPDVENAIQLKVGFEVDGWIVQKIDKSGITFRQENVTKKISFEKKGRLNEFISYENR